MLLLHKDTEAKSAQNILLRCAPMEFYRSFFKNIYWILK